MLGNMQNVSWPGWEVVTVVGRGSFGTVYEIQREIFGTIEKAALKVISIPQEDSDIEEMYSEGLDDESITEHFQEHLKSIVQEYNLMQELKGSANVVQCEDIRYVQHDNGIGWDIYIKMELLTPLHKVLSENIEEKTVEKIAKDICSALVLCESHNIVHRDIKPQNIFVSPHGDYKLGDFGIAKTVEKTSGGTKIGTYKYMAPEVYNNQPYGPSADIYSLGLVLYWLLNDRRLPFMPPSTVKVKVGMEDEARARRLSGEALEPPSNGSDKLKAIVLKACAYEPKDRYRSAEEMLDALNSDYNPPPAKHKVTLVIENAENRQRIDALEGVELFVDSIAQAYECEAISGEGIAVLLSDDKLGRYEYSHFEIIGDSGSKYSGALDSQQKARKCTVVMANENITICVFLKEKKTPNKKVLMAAAVAVLILIAAALGANNKPTFTSTNETAQITSKPTSKPTPKPIDKPTSTPVPTKDPRTEYIIYDSDKRYLTERDLSGLSHRECSLARNEIYARRGRIFNNEEITKYFKSKSWYIALYSSDVFDADVFNKFEKANIEFISDYEAANWGKGYF